MLYNYIKVSSFGQKGENQAKLSISAKWLAKKIPLLISLQQIRKKKQKGLEKKPETEREKCAQSRPLTTTK